MSVPQTPVNASPGEQERQALLRYRLLMERTQDLILLMRMDGQIIEANSAAVRAYGYDYDTLTTLNIRDLRESSTTPEVAHQMTTADHRGILFETRHKRADG